MPPKKKKGKGSKLARMSEEERLRYLQHRAELELEAKRRKQQLIAIFTKNKLKREEAFARLNTAKINEQWRFQLRQIKCKELYDDLEYLWKSFDRSLKVKDAIIHQLYNDLEKADIDHRRLQEVHIIMIDKFINRHRLRLELLHEKYAEAVMKIKTHELREMFQAEGELTDHFVHLETIVCAQNNFIDERLTETRTRNAINTTTIEYSKAEATADLKRRVGGKIDELWSQLNQVIMEYQRMTAKKYKHYEQLKENDLIHLREAANFPALQSQLLRTIDTLKNQEDTLLATSRNTITQLNTQIELLNGEMWKLRQDIRINQTRDEIQLKRLSLTSSGVVKMLKKFTDKTSALMVLMKMCRNLESNSLLIKKYTINTDESTMPNKDMNNSSVMAPYDKLEKFWEQYNYVKTGNIFMKKEYDQLLTENNKLRHTLRNYLISFARIPATNNKCPNFTG